jgi:thiamine-phosphate pyrophosphorylase
MKLIVITKENFFPNEAEWINQLMSRCSHNIILHIRKPYASETDIEALLQQINIVHYSRIVLHDHFSLAPKYQLMGIHLRGIMTGFSRKRKIRIPIGNPVLTKLS